MSKAREEAYKKGPLLIKIEPCPRTGKAEPCTEECTKECLEKPYTIFDPKPPRKKRKSSEEQAPPVVEIIEPARTSIVSSSSSSHVGSMKIESSGYVLKSPAPTPVVSPSGSRISSTHPQVPTPAMVIPLLADLRGSKTSLEKDKISTEENEISIKKSKTSMEESKTSIKEHESNVTETQALIEEEQIPTKQSNTSIEEGKHHMKGGEVSFGAIKIISEKRNMSEESIASQPSAIEQLPPSKEPPVHEIRPSQEEQDFGCVLEVLILEKHDKKCKSWKPPEGTTDWLKEYNVISHHAVPICQGHPSLQLFIPQQTIPYTCVCEKSTNVNRFSSCPVCSRCPCHGRQFKRTGYVSTTESEPIPPSEPLSFSDLSEPDTFIESASSRSSRFDYVPDFKSMPIVRQPQVKKYPFFVKCFVRSRKKPDEKADKGRKDNVVARCPQCPEPSCLAEIKSEKSVK